MPGAGQTGPQAAVRARWRGAALAGDGLHPGRARVGWVRVGWAALAAMAAAQVTSSRAGHLELFVWLIVALLAVAAAAFTAVTVGWPRAAAAAGAAFALGLVAEWAGTHTGVPFGAYRYTGLLRPALGSVPLAVPLAWAAMGLPGYAASAAIARGRAGRIAAGAAALTAWDLFLDPQMLRNGFWRWAHPGPYHGVPLTNFAGWLLVSAVLMAVFEAVLPNPGLPNPGLPNPGLPGSGQPGGRGAPELHPGLLAAYTVMAVMETVGFAVIFPGGRGVALAGALGMGIPAALAWARRRPGPGRKESTA
jgi:uncharacterized membrane protein